MARLVGQRFKSRTAHDRGPHPEGQAGRSGASGGHGETRAERDGWVATRS
jgi:hypothetical protein